jgi:hypothetical protein
VFDKIVAPVTLALPEIVTLFEKVAAPVYVAELVKVTFCVALIVIALAPLVCMARLPVPSLSSFNPPLPDITPSSAFIVDS